MINTFFVNKMLKISILSLKVCYFNSHERQHGNFQTNSSSTREKRRRESFDGGGGKGGEEKQRKNI